MTEGFLYDAILGWNSDKSELLVSAINTYIPILENSKDKIDILGNMRDIGDGGPDETFPFNIFLLSYEHDAVLGYESTIQLLSVTSMVFVISLVMNTDIIIAILVLLLVVLTILGQLGYLYLLGDYLNIVTVVNAVVAVGVSVDYIVHFIHAFKTSTESTRNDRVISAFGLVGASIFNGGFSTILAIFPLIFSQTYIFNVFFKCWLSLLVYGIGHALVLLPVLLSFIGPPDLQVKDQSTKIHPEGKGWLN